MFHFIIIEGMDCSGKSTLVNQLKNALHWDSKSLHHRKGDQFERYLKEYALQENTIFDRAHFSEKVYAQLWRGGNPFRKEQEEILNNIIKQRALVIFACPDSAVLKRRYEERDYEQQIRLYELEKSRELFCEALKTIPHRIYRSSNKEELKKLIEDVKDEVLCYSN